MNEQNNKAWVVTVDMGYGHQRAVHGLDFIANEEIITIGDSKYTSVKEKAMWKRMLHSYEFLSRSKSIPVIGKHIFNMLDMLLEIPSYYPKRNLSKKTFQVNLLYTYIKRGICKGIMQKLQTDKRFPIVTSFYAPAIAADLENYPEIYLIICDSDLNRVWVSAEPEKSNIKYLVPCYKAAQRLKSYGVSKDKIFLTGFPFSKKLTGNEDLDVLKKDLAQRLFYLDPFLRFWELHTVEIEHYLGKENCVFQNKRMFTVLFAVGGAGAQKEIGAKITFSFAERLKAGEMKLILSAGTRKEVKEYFEHVVNKLGNIPNIEIIYAETKSEYLSRFDEAVKNADVLWSKPSELVFYCGLGIPLIMTPTIGAQERANRSWVREIQAGFKQKEPEYADEWLFDLLHQGRLAEAAWAGFLKARKLGTYKIMEVLATGNVTESVSPLER